MTADLVGNEEALQRNPELWYIDLLQCNGQKQQEASSCERRIWEKEISLVIQIDEDLKRNIKHNYPSIVSYHIYEIRNLYLYYLLIAFLFFIIISLF